MIDPNSIQHNGQFQYSPAGKTLADETAEKLTGDAADGAVQVEDGFIEVDGVRMKVHHYIPGL